MKKTQWLLVVATMLLGVCGCRGGTHDSDSGISESRVEASVAPSQAESDAPHPLYDESDPYLRLAGRGLSELTEEDFRLLLETPVEELARIYGIQLVPPPTPMELPEHPTKADLFQQEEIDRQIARFHSRGYGDELPIKGLSFRYYDVGSDVLPGCLVAVSTEEMFAGFQMGSSISEITAAHGETELQFYGTGPYGYSGALYQYIEYRGRNGFDYHLECGDYIDRYADWYELEKTEWPWDTFPQQVAIIMVSREGSGTLYWR